MRWRFLPAFGLIALFLNAGFADAPKSDDAKKIQGTWKLVKLEGSEKLPPDGLEKVRIKITPDAIVIVVDGKTVNTFPYQLSAPKVAKGIHIEVTVLVDKIRAVELHKQIRLGIYELKQDDLKICIAMTTRKKLPENATRPTEFKAVDQFDLMTLTREK